MQTIRSTLTSPLQAYPHADADNGIRAPVNLIDENGAPSASMIAFCNERLLSLTGSSLANCRSTSAMETSKLLRRNKPV